MDSLKIDFLTQFICESDAIEGITDDKALVKAQVESGHTRGHVGALLHLDRMAQARELLTERDICSVQALITREQHDKGERRLPAHHVGHYRNERVWVGSRETSPHQEVPSLMREYFIVATRLLGANTYFAREERVRIIAKLHYAFLMIHPFADGNGRTSRAIAYYHYVYCGLEPFIFTSADRIDDYYPCFDDTDLECKKVQDYFLKRTKCLADF